MDEGKIDPLIQCSFCAKSQGECKALIMGPMVSICDNCVGLAWEICGHHYQTTEEEEFYRLQTARQHFSNTMLSLRRMFKWIGMAIRIDRWMQWMDAENPEGPEPELQDGDFMAYLRVIGGMTAQEIQDGLNECLAIVDSYKEKLKDNE